MSRRTYKDFTKPAPQEERASKRRGKKKNSSIKILWRFLLVCAALLCAYALLLNWKTVAPDSFVAWVDDVIDGTTGGSWPVELSGDTVFDMREVGANLVMVTDTAVKYYNTTGGESVRRTCAYASPLLRVSGKYVLLLETDGSRYRLESRSRIEKEQTVSGVIYTGAVSEKGDVAVVTDSSRSHISEVTVYSRSGNQRYQWLSSDWLVMDAAFSKDGNKLAVVGCHPHTGAMQSAILVFDLRGRQEQPVQYITDGTLFSRVHYTRNGTVIAVGDKQARFVNPTGSLDTTVDYENVELIGFAFGNNEAALITRPYGSQEGGVASLYNAAGDLKTAAEFEGAFRDVASQGNSFLVLSDNYLYYVNNKGIRERAHVSADCLMTGTVEGKPLVLGLTQITRVDWDDEDTQPTVITTAAPTTSTVASTTASTAVSTTASTTATQPSQEDA